MYFENKFSSPSTEGDEADLDIDYDYQEVRSFDRSSAGSIPWAEDAIKKNQQEWERIESFFSNENNEYLPTEDKDLCREILEWKRVFPPSSQHKHEKQKTVSKNLPESDEDSDETLIESPKRSSLKSRKIPLKSLLSTSKLNQNENNIYEKQSAKSVSFPIKSTNNTNMGNLSKNFAKDLRISSVPKNNKRTSIAQHSNSSFPTIQNMQPEAVPIKIIQRHYPHPHQLFPSQSAKYLLEKYPNSIVTIEKKISPHSATYSRMAPLYNIIRTTGNTKIIPVFNQTYQFQSRYNTSALQGGANRNLKNQIILPALNAATSSSTNPNGNNLRSISAVHRKRYANTQIRNISQMNQMEYMDSLSASNKYKYP